MLRIVWYTVIVLATLMALVLLWQFRIALVLFLLSIVVAAAFRPLIDRMARRGFPRWLALGLTYLLVVLSVVGLLILSGGPFLHDFQTAVDDFATTYERARTEWPRGGTLFQRSIAEQLPPLNDLYNSLSGEKGAALAKGVLGVASNLAGLLSNIGIILILSLYWNADIVHLERMWLSLIPVEKRNQARDIWRKIETEIGAYIRSELIQSLLAGFLLWLGFRAVNLNYPVLLALTGASAWLVPYLGALLAVILPLLVGLGTSTTLGVSSALFTLLVLAVMELVVEPRFFPRKQYSSLLLVLTVITLAMVYGLIGILLAPPVAAVIQILGSNLLSLPAQSAKVKSLPESESSTAADLFERLARMQVAIESAPTPPAPEAANLLTRLKTLMEQTDQYLQEQASSNGK